MGDFNDHVLHKVYKMSSRMGLKRRINKPIHIKGNELDLILTDKEDAKVQVLTQVDIADHLPVCIQIPDDILIDDGPKIEIWNYMYKRADWQDKQSTFFRERASTK